MATSAYTLVPTPVDLSSSNASGILAGARFPALTGDVTTSSGALATTIANIPSAPTVAGTANTITFPSAASGTVTTLAATQTLTNKDLTSSTNTFLVYTSSTAPTGVVFIQSVASVNLKTAGTTDIFTVPTGKTYVCIGAFAVVTATSGAGAGTESFKIVESGASNVMASAVTSGSGTPVIGTYYTSIPVAGGAPYLNCAAGNKVQVTVNTSQAGSTTVTGTVYVIGFYF